MRPELICRLARTLQFRAPFTAHRIANGELGSIGTITEEELTVSLDNGREVSFEPDKFRHLDHGYAVTSYSSQSQTVDRVLINADANESPLTKKRPSHV